MRWPTRCYWTVDLRTESPGIGRVEFRLLQRACEAVICGELRRTTGEPGAKRLAGTKQPDADGSGRGREHLGELGRRQVVPVMELQQHLLLHGKLAEGAA